MNVKSNLLVAAALLAGGFGFTSTALAGEGGIAGSAAFQLSNNQVNKASVAVAVGKSTAYAAASTSTPSSSSFSYYPTPDTAAFATGAGGTLFTSGSPNYAISYVNADTNMSQQANTIGKTTDINVINGVVKQY